MKFSDMDDETTLAGCLADRQCMSELFEVAETMGSDQKSLGSGVKNRPFSIVSGRRRQHRNHSGFEMYFPSSLALRLPVFLVSLSPYFLHHPLSPPFHAFICSHAYCLLL